MLGNDMYKVLCKECSSPVVIDDPVQKYVCTGCGKQFDIEDDIYTEKIRNINLEARRRIAFSELLQKLEEVNIVTDFVMGNARTLKRYKGKDRVVTIPYGVFKIGMDAFARNEHIEKVIIPDSTRIIDTGAFMWCRNLREVVFGGNETRICDEAFVQCHALESIQLPNTLRSIGDSAFYSSGLRSIEIPGSVTDIGDNAFSGCDKLENVHVLQGDVLIGHRSFANCMSLKKVSVFPGKKVICNDAFFGCNSFDMDMHCSVTITTKDFYKRFVR